MTTVNSQKEEIEAIRRRIEFLYDKRKSCPGLPLVTLDYRTHSSYVTRKKVYKETSDKIDCSKLKRVLKIDPVAKIAIVEPRVTIEELVKATLPFGLVPAIVPEIKDITVGGAIMGAAAESTSHTFGCFNDSCNAFEFLAADGKLLRATPTQNEELYYGLPGSYGSLGCLTSAEVRLIPAKKGVRLRYHVSDPKQAIEKLLTLSRQASSDFLDGIILKRDLAVVVEGNLVEEDSAYLPRFSAEPATAPYYYRHAFQIALDHPDEVYEELMSHRDYFFRYDPGSFWVGAYLFHFPLLTSLLFEGVLSGHSQKKNLTASEIKRFSRIPSPNLFTRTLLKYFTSCKILCKLLHRAEDWVSSRFVIQDFCIPESVALEFLNATADDPGIYPMWLLPIKSTVKPQIFSPHLTDKESNVDYFINFGLYGIPSQPESPSLITRELERLTEHLHGRKVLYSHSYYTPEQFWQIYSKDAYERLREQTCAKGFWPDITDKVLSRRA